MGIDLDGPDTGACTEKWERDRARPGADVDDELASPHLEFVDDPFDEGVVSEEVLTELTSASIALGRASLGHGTAQSSA